MVAKGATWEGGGRWGLVPPPEFHSLAKDMSLNRGATHFKLGLRPCFISSILLQIYLVAPLIISRYCFIVDLTFVTCRKKSTDIMTIAPPYRLVPNIVKLF